MSKKKVCKKIFTRSIFLNVNQFLRKWYGNKVISKKDMFKKMTQWMRKASVEIDIYQKYCIKTKPISQKRFRKINIYK